MSGQPRYNPRHYGTTSNSEMARLQDAVEMAYQNEQVEWHAGEPEMKPESNYDRFERLILTAKPSLDRLMQEFGGGGHAEAPFCDCSGCSRRRAYHVLLTNPYEDRDDEDSDPCESAQDPPEHQAGDPAPTDSEDVQE